MLINGTTSIPVSGSPDSFGGKYFFLPPIVQRGGVLRAANLKSPDCRGQSLHNLRSHGYMVRPDWVLYIPCDVDLPDS